MNKIELSEISTKKLLAFHNDRAIQKKYLTRVSDHRKADQIVQGHGYWNGREGCAVGCTLHSRNHAAYEAELGIPVILARLEDRIFEGLERKRARTWPERFLQAPKIGADLSMVWPQFAHWMLVDPHSGVIKFAKTDTTRNAIQAVADLFSRWIAGVKPPREEWRRCRSNAAAAAAAASASASASAAVSAAAYAATANAAAASAAYANAAATYASAAAYADDAAAYAAYAAYTTRKKFFDLASEKLLALMTAAPAEKALS
jgi:hypothetical protein